MSATREGSSTASAAARSPGLAPYPEFPSAPVPSGPASPITPSAGTDPVHAPTKVPIPVPESAKWGWALRRLSESEVRLEPPVPSSPPRVGDVAVVRVAQLGYHTSLVTTDNRKRRIYPGDLLAGVFGHRYATDAYEAEVDGTEDLSLLTAGGMIGTVRSRHRGMAHPTSLEFVGYLADAEGTRVNLKERFFRPPAGPVGPAHPLIVVVGTGMNSGKTTVLSQTLHGLSRQGLRVAAGKLTGSVSNRDVDEMRSADAASVIDFSDYGFPSTYLADRTELAQLWEAILAEGAEGHPDLQLMEIADGVLQRETAMILRDDRFRRRTTGVILAADCAISALGAVEELRGLGYTLLGVSGAFTSSPLFVREFRSRSALPVLPSTGGGEELAASVLAHLSIPAWTGAAFPGEGPLSESPVRPHASRVSGS